MIKLHSLYTILPLTFLLMAFVIDDGWELVRDKHDIKVYTRKTEGEKLKDSRVMSVFDGTPAEIIKILIDFEAYDKWIPRCKEARTLAKISETEFYYYSRYAAPWPVSDRDMVAHFDVKTNPETGAVKIIITGVPDYIPKENGVVRIPEFFGIWELTPLPGGKVAALNENQTDPGGSLPKWLANSAAVDTPFETFLNLRELLNI